MGKSKVKKRSCFLKQIVFSFVLVLVFSLITSAAAITVFYIAYHEVNNYESLNLNDANMLKIIDYANKNGSTIIEAQNRGVLDQMVNGCNLEYSIKRIDNSVIYDSQPIDKNREQHNFSWDIMEEICSKILRTSSGTEIPLADKKTDKISCFLVLSHKNGPSCVILSFIDGIIPFLCFLFFTFVFAGRLSLKIRKPLRELMKAVEKIKARDVEFTIEGIENNNEISDLAEALEELRRELKDSLIREWQLEQDRRDMVSYITHDLRTPLAIIQGHIEVLQDSFKNDKDKLDSYLEIIMQNNKRAKKLVDDMNMLSEIDSPVFKLYTREVDICMFLTNKVSELKLLADKSEINIQADIIDNREDKKPISIDPDRLAEVINNIVGNSIRYTPRNGAVSVSVLINQTRADFKICDTGPGFKEKDINNIFKKFYKGDASRSLEKGNSGLGLYISKSIIERFGGTIKSYNLPQGGACTEFYILY